MLKQFLFDTYEGYTDKEKEAAEKSKRADYIGDLCA